MREARVVPSERDHPGKRVNTTLYEMYASAVGALPGDERAHLPAGLAASGHLGDATSAHLGPAAPTAVTAAWAKGQGARPVESGGPEIKILLHPWWWYLYYVD